MTYAEVPLPGSAIWIATNESRALFAMVFRSLEKRQ